MSTTERAASKKREYCREYMRKWRENPKNAERQRQYMKERYAKLKNDPAYLEKLHKNRLNYFRNYLETFGYTVIPPKEEKDKNV